MPDSDTINKKDRDLIASLRILSRWQRPTVTTSPADCARIVAVIDGLEGRIAELEHDSRDLKSMPDISSGRVKSADSVLDEAANLESRSPIFSAGEIKEAARRTYYQNIVYDVCNLLDAAAGGRSSIVCGTATSPTRNVQKEIKGILDQFKEDAAALQSKDAEIEVLKATIAQLESRPPVIAAPVGSFVPTGEVREAAAGEYALGTQGPHLCRAPTGEKYPIYRTIEPDEHGAYTHVLRLVGRDIPPKAGQLWCNWYAPLGCLMTALNDCTLPYRWVYELVPLAPAAPDEPDDGFSAWWNGLEIDTKHPWNRYISGSLVAGEKQARAIWKAARKAHWKAARKAQAPSLCAH